MSTNESRVYLTKEDGVAFIQLGAADERAVILNDLRMNSLETALDSLMGESSLKGVIFLGSSAQMFCAGADINAIRDVTDPKQGEGLAKRGQDIFDKIEKLPFTTVAAISGPCVGGGCELALACNHRIMLDSKSSKIGLPEVRLGILPGFGGTQRLPRLVGLPKALEIILKAKVLRPEEALKAGLVDNLVRVEQGGGDDAAFLALKKRAVDLLVTKGFNRKPVPLVDRLLTNTSVGRSMVKKKALANVLSETRGLYPAPLSALDSTITGLQHGYDFGIKEERRRLGELIASAECKSLVHLFTASEGAQKLGRAVKEPIDELTVTIFGGGTMGAGIAGVFLGSGATVRLVEPQAAVRSKARVHIESFIAKRRYLTPEQRQKIFERLQITEDMAAVAGSDLVIEAIVENLEVKKELFLKIAERCESDTILATNTSSLSVSEIQSSISAPERFLGMHFFNPAEKMMLVEIIRGKQTSDRVAVLGAAIVSKLGKYPVVVEDVPGFLVNRILTPYLVEASNLLYEGHSIEEIDRCALRFGMPMGPLRLLDEVGLDIAAKVARGMYDAYGERMEGHNFAETLAATGRLGRKSGSGFYVYKGEAESPEPAIRRLLGLSPNGTHLGTKPEEVAERLILSLVNEAIRCLDDGVAGQPGKEAADQIDLASVMGFGFPPFRGGAIWYAENLGVEKLLARLSDFEKRFGPRFRPAEGLKHRAEKKKKLVEAVG